MSWSSRLLIVPYTSVGGCRRRRGRAGPRRGGVRAIRSTPAWVAPASISSRRGLARHRQRLSGSTDSLRGRGGSPAGRPTTGQSHGAATLADQPEAMKRSARSSSSCGCEGRAPLLAVLLGVSTSPRAEVVLPDAVDRSPAPPGACPREDRVSPGQAAAAAPERPGILRRQHREETARTTGPVTGRVARTCIGTSCAMPGLYSSFRLVGAVGQPNRLAVLDAGASAVS